MTDLVTTIERVAWYDWVIAGARVGGLLWTAMLGRRMPRAGRLYLVAHDRVRGFVTWDDTPEREPKFEPMTLGAKHSRPHRPDHNDLAYVRGFAGSIFSWWERTDEIGFPDWQTRDLWLNRSSGRKKRRIEKTKRERERRG